MTRQQALTRLHDTYATVFIVLTWHSKIDYEFYFTASYLLICYNILHVYYLCGLCECLQHMVVAFSVGGYNE